MASYTGNSALSRIRKLAGLVNVESSGHNAPAEDTDTEAVFAPGCTIRNLPDRLQVDAAGVAAAVNPVNLPPSLMQMAALMPDRPLSLTIMVSKYFGPAARTLTVSFMEATSTNLRNRIIQHMNAWSACCGVNFRFTTGTGQVRISRAGAGYWSYLGTDILLIPRNQPTMNLQGFSMTTPESEYKRVVRHETGHTLGFPHEHMRKELVDRIDPAKAYRFFLANQGWSKAQVDAQVLTPLKQANIMGTPADQTSIMCYQLPASIMKDGQPIIGGLDINATDCSFSGRVYPKPARAARAARAPKAAQPSRRTGFMGMAAAPAGGYEEIALDWGKDQDVDVEAVVAEVQNQGGKAG